MIPFVDLRPAQWPILEEIRASLERVVSSGWYLLGPELEQFELELAESIGCRRAIGVASGTDAIELILRASGIGAGDEVITVSHTAVATVCAIERAGATPVLVDVEPSFLTIDPARAEAAISPRTRAIVAVHLYGQPADMSALRSVADRQGLLLVEDCAQAQGGAWEGRNLGTLGDAAAFSFYPTKNLGALGDAGAVVTSDGSLADRVRRLRTYGQVDRQDAIEPGINSRLDEAQAAVMRVKLRHLPAWIEARRTLARRYQEALAGMTESLEIPADRPGARHAWHLFVVRSEKRDPLRAWLADQGIETLIHYSRPVHQQTAYRTRIASGSLRHTERMSERILSLPFWVGMTPSQVREVASAIGSFRA